jgi:hypothetical protein
MSLVSRKRRLARSSPVLLGLGLTCRRRKRLYDRGECIFLVGLALPHFDIGGAGIDVRRQGQAVQTLCELFVWAVGGGGVAGGGTGETVVGFAFGMAGETGVGHWLY